MTKPCAASSISPASKNCSPAPPAASTPSACPASRPLAAPLFFEPGKIPIHGQARDRLAQDAARQLLREAGLD